jgi:hypothetical protein
MTKAAALALLLVAVSAAAQTAPPPEPTPAPEKKPKKFRDPEDGAFDIGGGIGKGYGLVPIIVPITEPAVGYGAAGGTVLIQRKEEQPGVRFQKPNLSFLGGMATENGTWGIFGGHSGSWKDGKIETLIGGGYAQVNLDYYGVSDDSPFATNPISYTLEPAGGLVQGAWRVGDTPLLAGISYTYAKTKVSFANDALPEEITVEELDSSIGGLTPSLTYDSRNNTFTPTKGLYSRLSAGIFADWLGGDFDYQLVTAGGMVFLPLSDVLFASAKVDGQFGFDDIPFYVKPYVDLRGAAIRRYVGENVALIEIEARWQFSRRWSVVGFGGAGVAWTDRDILDTQTDLFTGGAGFRYLIARQDGLHMGLDVGIGPDTTAIYVVFGNAWYRP